MSNQFEDQLRSVRSLHVQQVWEGFELLGFETRNKYRILDESLQPLAFAAEQSKGFGALILRQILGHWRSFEVVVFDQSKRPVYRLELPFRWFFKTLIVKDNQGKELGHLQQKFAIFRKKFDAFDGQGRLIGQVNSSFFRFWTFELMAGTRSLGKVQKKWSGALGELFTDKDNFVVSFDPTVEVETRTLLIGLCLMADIIYFEKKGNGGLFGD